MQHPTTTLPPRFDHDPEFPFELVALRGVAKLFREKLGWAREHVGQIVVLVGALAAHYQEELNAPDPHDWFAAIPHVDEWLDHLEQIADPRPLADDFPDDVTNDQLTLADVAALISVESVLRVMLTPDGEELTAVASALSPELLPMLTEPLEEEGIG